jgi:hypothetical protein
MKNKIMSRAWISPVTAITYLIVSITGLFLVFHIHIGNIRAIHEWIGYVFIAIGLLHFVLNFKPFLNYFPSRSATISIVACLIATNIFMFFKEEPKPIHLMQLLDTNHDGVIDATEIAAAPQRIKALDVNNDGKITADDLRELEIKEFRRQHGLPTANPQSSGTKR